MCAISCPRSASPASGCRRSCPLRYTGTPRSSGGGSGAWTCAFRKTRPSIYGWLRPRFRESSSVPERSFPSGGWWAPIGPQGIPRRAHDQRGRAVRGTGGGCASSPISSIGWCCIPPLRLVEYHHHDGFDLFPDSGRQIPFGTGTSISYNYTDYRFRNSTDAVFQLVVWTTDTHLGEDLRSDAECSHAWHVEARRKPLCAKTGGSSGTR